MARKHGINLQRVNFFCSLAGLTNDGTIPLGRLDQDYTEVVSFTICQGVAGVGAQNCVYTLKTAPAGSATADATVSGATGNVANATAGAAGAGVGNGVSQANLAEGRNLILDANYAAGITSGSAQVNVSVLFRA